MAETEYDQEAVIATLNRILETELSGVVRYTHYSLMVFGYGRIPIVDWLRGQAAESLLHAQRAGELVTHLERHPSLAIGPLLESHKHDLSDILRESLEHERTAAALYRALFSLVEGRSILLEDYAREMVAKEELHIGDVRKMLRAPGEESGKPKG
jgi:bacterioferritin